MCQGSTGHEIQNMENVFNGGPIIFLDILNTADNNASIEFPTKLMSARFFLAFGGQARFSLQIYRPIDDSSKKTTNELRLIASHVLDIELRGLNYVDLSRVETATLSPGDQLALHFETKLGALPFRFTEPEYEADNNRHGDEHDDGMKAMMAVRPMRPGSAVKIGEVINFNGQHRRVEFPISFEFLQYTENESGPDSDTSSNQFEASKRMRSDNGHQTSHKIKNFDFSDQISDFDDLFSERAKIEKCPEPIPFSKLFKVSDQSLLCNLKSIVTDEMISACAKVGQNCKNGRSQIRFDH